MNSATYYLFENKIASIECSIADYRNELKTLNMRIKRVKQVIESNEEEIRQLKEDRSALND